VSTEHSATSASLSKGDLVADEMKSVTIDTHRAAPSLVNNHSSKKSGEWVLTPSRNVISPHSY
jgi:hypothetical protein